VALVRADVSEELITSMIRVTRNGALRTVLRLLLVVTAEIAISPILVTLMMEAIFSSEMSVLAKTRRRNIPEDGIVQFHS
jgi:hypothetical protein